MYIETSSPRVQGDDAKLSSPTLKFSGNMCLKFFYHMYGATIGRLDVIIDGKTVFSASGNKGNKWFEASISTSGLSGMYAVSNISLTIVKVFLQFFQDDFSSAPAVFSSCRHIS